MHRNFNHFDFKLKELVHGEQGKTLAYKHACIAFLLYSFIIDRISCKKSVLLDN